MDLEILDNPAFLMLGGGAVLAEIIGFIMSRKFGLGGFPWWQMILLIAGTLVAAAVIANRE